MKGIILKEFLDMVEKKYSADVAAELVAAANLPSGGIYNAIGTYDFQELLALADALSRQVQRPLQEVVRGFGRHLAQVFTTQFPNYFSGCTNTFGFLRKVDGQIHNDVRRLYPDAQLPKFTYNDTDPDCFVLRYQSALPFADLAFGLIEGCALYYGDNIQIRVEDSSGNKRSDVKFYISRQNA